MVTLHNYTVEVVPVDLQHRPTGVLTTIDIVFRVTFVQSTILSQITITSEMVMEPGLD